MSSSKIPKWQFEKFPGADENLAPQMKSVGEVMAIGRTFKEALMKAVRSLETGQEDWREDLGAAPVDAAAGDAAAGAAELHPLCLSNGAFGARSRAHDGDGPVVPVSD